ALALMIRRPNQQGQSYTILDITTGKERLSRRTDRLIFGLDLSSDGKLVAWTDLHEKLRLVDTASGEEIGSVSGLIRSPHFSPDGKSLVACVGGDVRLWQVPSLKELATIARLDINAVGPTAFSPDGKLLALADPDALILWDISARKELGRLPEKQI